MNNTVGQILLARRMGKTRVIAETGAGQHGVATATVAARRGVECVVYMGAEDIQRQTANVYRMRLLGAQVPGVESGSPHAEGRAQRGAARLGGQRRQHLLHHRHRGRGRIPNPQMVRDFQAIIGRETRAQMLRAQGRLPDAVVACVGGGSNAIGMFYPFSRR
ncbi:MAG: pyridoxal-phosphate dependent enzyme [Candidatus Manganitrophus sp.]|nr:MAG: pyridoxal-phosphate dependent enzyme [Candidatus Manganitrophus sp.]